MRTDRTRVDVMTPVMWSPPALNARLEAKQAIEALPRRTHGFEAEARALLSRIIAQVERRQLSLRAASERLRELTRRLESYRAIEDAKREPREWRVLSNRERTSHAH